MVILRIALSSFKKLCYWFPEWRHLNDITLVPRTIRPVLRHGRLSTSDNSPGNYIQTPPASHRKTSPNQTLQTESIASSREKDIKSPRRHRSTTERTSLAARLSRPPRLPVRRGCCTTKAAPPDDGRNTEEDASSSLMSRPWDPGVYPGTATRNTAVFGRRPANFRSDRKKMPLHMTSLLVCRCADLRLSSRITKSAQLMVPRTTYLSTPVAVSWGLRFGKRQIDSAICVFLYCRPFWRDIIKK